MPVHQLERLTSLAKQVQRLGFRHVYYIGHLLPGSLPSGDLHSARSHRLNGLDQLLALAEKTVGIYNDASSIALRLLCTVVV